MIEVTKQEDAHETPLHWQEYCCFCRKKTIYWYTPKDVACCQDCATRAEPKDVPSKKQWCRREDIVSKGESHDC